MLSKERSCISLNKPFVSTLFVVCNCTLINIKMSHLAFDALSTSDHFTFFIFLQTEIVKRMSAIIGQVLPFLSQEHQQQVATAVERAKQVTMSDLNSVVGVSICIFIFNCFYKSSRMETDLSNKGSY